MAAAKKTSKPRRKPRAKKAQITAPVTKSGSEKTITVRKISNGYVIREETYDKKGTFNIKETFTKTAPELKINV